MATEYTENYDLDLYVGEDKPNLRDQYNAAMGKVDAALQGLHEGHADNVEAIASANASIAANATEIGKLQGTDATHTSQITALQNGQTSLNTRMGTAEDDIDLLQAAINGKAPVNHASSGTTYGAATAANYGHVKLADTPSASGASAGIAATPKMVQDALGGKLYGDYICDTVSQNGITVNVYAVNLQMSSTIKLWLYVVTLKIQTQSSYSPNIVFNLTPKAEFADLRLLTGQRENFLVPPFDQGYSDAVAKLDTDFTKLTISGMPNYTSSSGYYTVQHIGFAY